MNEATKNLLLAAFEAVEVIDPVHFELLALNDGWYCEISNGNDNSDIKSAYGGGEEIQHIAKAILKASVKTKKLKELCKGGGQCQQ